MNSCAGDVTKDNCQVGIIDITVGTRPDWINEVLILVAVGIVAYVAENVDELVLFFSNMWASLMALVQPGEEEEEDSYPDYDDWGAGSGWCSSDLDELVDDALDDAGLDPVFITSALECF